MHNPAIPGTATTSRRCFYNGRISMPRSLSSQHEYQHQQEFGHDGVENSPASSAGGAKGARKAKPTLAKHTGGVVKGTGNRGRVVAVAADRRRAERTLRKEEHDSNIEDLREAQRARWIMQMQHRAQQQPSSSVPREIERVRKSGKGPAEPSKGGREPREDSSLSAVRHRIPSPSPRRTNGLRDANAPSETMQRSIAGKGVSQVWSKIWCYRSLMKKEYRS